MIRYLLFIMYILQIFFCFSVVYCSKGYKSYKGEVLFPFFNYSILIFAHWSIVFSIDKITIKLIIVTVYWSYVCYTLLYRICNNGLHDAKHLVVFLPML